VKELGRERARRRRAERRGPARRAAASTASPSSTTAWAWPRRRRARVRAPCDEQAHGLDDLTAVGTLGFRWRGAAEHRGGRRRAARSRAARRRRPARPSTPTRRARVSRARPPPRPATTIDVQDLFATTPARRKFLRTPQTEVGHVVDCLTRLALAAPQTGFRLVSETRELFHHPPVDDLRQRLGQVLGVPRAAGFVEVKANDGGVSVEGLLGPPRESVASARLVWTYVGFRTPRAGAVRWVRDRVLTHAVLEGYESLVVRGRHPAVVLVVRVPPGELDVNVHPAKLEIRFRRSSDVHQLVAGALRARLRSALAPVGESAPVSEPLGVAEPVPAYEAPPRDVTVPTLPLDRPVESGQASLWQPAAQGFRPLRFVGQLFDGYLLCERDGQALLIDQHAAHERVLYERLQAAHAARGVEVDTLLVPETISVSAVECGALVEHAPTLREAGLDGEPFGDGTYLLRTMPRALRDHDAGALVRALAAELAATGASTVARRAVDRVLATIACHSAVRVGQRLQPTQVDALLASMDGVPVNAHCPHGRPVAVELRRSAIEALFQR
jgi:DNA mismatch repair protein MutL